ncbi:lipoprotein [Anaerotruncus colihominis]|nr:hypothetical protein [Anaerotruncus colihominis]
MYKRILTVVLVLSMLLALSGCDEKAPTPPSQMQSSTEEKEVDKTEQYEVESVPYPEVDGEDSEFVNQLDLVNNQLLLPMAITVPDKVPNNYVPSVVVGEEYSLSPNSKWIVKMNSDTATFYHEDGIAVQLTMCGTNSKMDVEAISKQLDSFYSSFIEKSEPSYKNVFIADKLAGKEVSFQIDHDGQAMYICVGAFVDSKSVVIYTVNYFVPESGDSVIVEQVDNLFGTFLADGKQVSRK